MPSRDFEICIKMDQPALQFRNHFIFFHQLRNDHLRLTVQSQKPVHGNHCKVRNDVPKLEAPQFDQMWIQLLED